MEVVKGYHQKPLTLTLREWERRGKNLQNLVIDKYFIYQRIGSGSFGEVYKGMDEKTKRQVAVKLINLSEISLERVKGIREIKARLAETQPRIMSICDSPHLIKLYDVYSNKDLKMLMIQYCNGKTLQQQINQKGTIEESQAVVISKHIINGLMEMHKHKIVHRDLKAENIISHNGIYKIIDFGFSKKLAIANEMNQVKGTSLGTITTMAPEVMNRKAYGVKADIWSLGVIFFQMIIGRYPYDSLSAQTLYAQIRRSKIFSSPQPSRFYGTTPSQQAYNLMRFLLVVDSEERPSWKKVMEHPLMKNVSSGVNQRFIRDCEIKMSQTVNCDEVMDQQDIIRSVNAQVGEKEKVEDKNLRPIQEDAKEDNEESFLAADQRKLPRYEVKHSSKENQKLSSPKEKLQNQTKAGMVETTSVEVNKPTQKKQETFPVKREEVKGDPNPLLATLGHKEEKSSTTVDRVINFTAKLEREKQKEQERLNHTSRVAQKKARHMENNVLRVKEREQQQPSLIREVTKEEAEKMQRQMNQEEAEQFRWVQKAHLQVLKTQLIFGEIIRPMHEVRIHESGREAIELMYLLITRCFNNMSPIQWQLDIRKHNKQIIENLKKQVQPLYQKVISRFQEYSRMLTKTENGKWSMFTDFFSKNFTKADFKRKESFLTGLEKEDYSKEDQIEFTTEFYKLYPPKQLKILGMGSRTVRLLTKYKAINFLDLQRIEAKKSDFKQAVEAILAFQ